MIINQDRLITSKSKQPVSFLLNQNKSFDLSTGSNDKDQEEKDGESNDQNCVDESIEIKIEIKFESVEDESTQEQDFVKISNGGPNLFEDRFLVDNGDLNENDDKEVENDDDHTNENALQHNTVVYQLPKAISFLKGDICI